MKLTSRSRDMKIATGTAILLSSSIGFFASFRVCDDPRSSLAQAGVLCTAGSPARLLVLQCLQQLQVSLLLVRFAVQLRDQQRNVLAKDCHYTQQLLVASPFVRMKFTTSSTAAALLLIGGAESFRPSALLSAQQRSSRSQLSMVLEKPPPTKKLAKIEQLKIDSDHLVHPLKEVGCHVVC